MLFLSDITLFSRISRMILDKLMNWRRRRAATKRKPTFVSPTATPERLVHVVDAVLYTIR